MSLPKPVFLVTTLATGHVAGDGTLALQAGDGARLGALGAGQVYAITAVVAPGLGETILSNFLATGATTDTLTGVAADGHSVDVDVPSGTPMQVRLTPAWQAAVQDELALKAPLTDLSLKAPLASPTFAGMITVAAGAPSLLFHDNDTSPDFGKWYWVAADEVFYYKTINDVLNLDAAYMTVVRSGVTPTAVNFPSAAPVRVGMSAAGAEAAQFEVKARDPATPILAGYPSTGGAAAVAFGPAGSAMFAGTVTAAAFVGAGAGLTLGSVPNAADDTAAAALAPPIPVGGIYRTGSALKVRVT